MVQRTVSKVSLLFMVLYREALDRLCVRLNMYLVIQIYGCSTCCSCTKPQPVVPFGPTQQARDGQPWVDEMMMRAVGACAQRKINILHNNGHETVLDFDTQNSLRRRS